MLKSLRHFRLFVLLPVVPMLRAAAATSPTPAAETSDLFDLGKQLFDQYAPPEVKSQYEFPAKEQWDSFAARLQQVLQTSPLEDLPAYAPQARAALLALRTFPEYEDYVSWLEERLDYLDAANDLTAPNAPTTPNAIPRPGPTFAPTPTPLRRSPPSPIPYYDYWLTRVRERAAPAGAQKLVPSLRTAFAAEGLAPELIWIAEAESSFNPAARSPVGAKGLFQLMPETAKALGLSTYLPDDRTSPEKSGRAAARYLKSLHARFRNWPLAFAAYNAGEGRVSRALIARSAKDFAGIATSLPSETRMYVPKVCALITARSGTSFEKVPAPRDRRPVRSSFWLRLLAPRSFSPEMGFFDRLTGKKNAGPNGSSPNASPDPTPNPSRVAETPAATPAIDPTPTPIPGGVMPRLAAARELLDLKNLAGAMAIYEEVLAAAGARPDILVTISGDLGSHGHVQPIVELVAPRYDAEKHGPATGLNILQAYLALRNANAAQHILDLLFALNRPELEERLYGFSNAIADLMANASPPMATVEGAGSSGASELPPGIAHVSLVSISRPIWHYGLEAMTQPVLPPKDGKMRRIAFAQLALPGQYKDIDAAMKQPEDELGRFSRAFPLWMAEAFYFSPHYSPIAAIGLMEDPTDGKFRALFPSEWTSENLRQLVDSTSEPLDYIVTGALRQTSGDYEIMLRVFEVKKFRERKTFSARWTPLTAETELKKLSEMVRTFMEWTPEKQGLPYSPPTDLRRWFDALSNSLAFFLTEKNVLSTVPAGVTLDALAAQAASTPAASLAWLTARARAKQLGFAPIPSDVPLSDHPLVVEAEQLLG